MARIKVIQKDEAEGRLHEIYSDIINKRGKLAEVHKIQSLRPESIVHHMDLYMEIMFARSDLSRAEREMMAIVVSVSNGCEYCRLHHSKALNHYWRNENKLSSLINDFNNAVLTKKEISLCEFARDLTLKPGSFNEERSIETLKRNGLSDNAVLDATLVVAYFNFINRIVLALGVENDNNELKGYNFKCFSHSAMIRFKFKFIRCLVPVKQLWSGFFQNRFFKFRILKITGNIFAFHY